MYFCHCFKGYNLFDIPFASMDRKNLLHKEILPLTLLHSERPKLHRVLAVLSAIGFSEQPKPHRVLVVLSAIAL